MVATQILAKVDGSRLQKAVDGLVSGAYRVTVTGQGEQEIRGYVTNGDGKQYGVALNAGQSFCSCPDAMYRQTVCKHAVAVALYVMRHPEQPQQPKAWHVGDIVERNGHTGRVVCVSGEFLSVRWDHGRTFPLTREELEA